MDRCTGCHGLWFDLMEQRHLRAATGAERIDTGAPDAGAAQNPRAKVNCPRCTAPMTHLRDVDRRDVEYEYCAVCNGTFFDAGEFSRYADVSFIGSLKRMFGK